MKLRCLVEVNSRLLATNNLRSRNKALQASIVIGKSNSTENKLCLLICTSQNSTGTKFQVKDNVENIFHKFVNDGKATIRLKEPCQDIIISKADPVKLKAFLQILRFGVLGKDVEINNLSSLKAAKTVDIERPKTSLTITQRKDYPVLTGFPSSLTKLRVNGCNLIRFDKRIARLSSLKLLDLSDNNIEEISVEFSENFTLQELNMSHNKLKEFPESLFKNHSLSSLVALDLRYNQLKILPPSFHHLSSLVTLKLDHNNLLRLPHQIGHLKKLKYLSAADNSIQSLPGGLLTLRLETIDLFENPFQCQNIFYDRLHFPSLLELTALSILKNRVPYVKQDLPRNLSDLLSSVHHCLCKKVCLKSHIFTIVPISLKNIAHTVTSLDSFGSQIAPFEIFLCSKTCYRRYKRCQWFI